MAQPIPRRRLAAAAFALALLAALHPARAQDATSFVKGFADQLVAVVNGPGSEAAKKQALVPIIEHDVDVARIARFCLGQYWSRASASQQQEYTQLFHGVLLTNIQGHLGEYEGVRYTLGEASPRGGSVFVSSVITRPNAPSVNVQWVVSTDGAPKVIDVVAEGTSLRVTERADYASYLQRNGGNIDALIAALRRQAAG